MGFILAADSRRAHASGCRDSAAMLRCGGTFLAPSRRARKTLRWSF
ncbi:hypothetical protein BURCENK562V_C6922 [Burkholderia cenocepacia K56-2Valvano]|nr:hypothetical protein BURCENK562V_C6922 [Burkholderia cenocepacia K56-2Valvano]